MPLLLIAKTPSNAFEREWRGIDFNTTKRLLIWSDRKGLLPPGADVSSHPTALSLEQQVGVLLNGYHVFAYRDHDLLDLGDGGQVKSYASFLNTLGEKPDFSEPTLECGWLMPNGDFVGCRPGHHADMLRYTLEKEVYYAKIEGWVAVQDTHIVHANKKIPFTNEQEAALRTLGFDDLCARTVVPSYTKAYEAVSELYVRIKDRKNVPQLLDSAKAFSLLCELQEAINRAYGHRMTVAPEFNKAILSRPKDLDSGVQRGNAALSRIFDKPDTVLTHR